MRQIIATLILVATVSVASAQDGFTHFFIKGGANYKKAGIATMGLDFASKYHSSYELGLMYYRNTSKYENYLIGFNYKPVVVRNKNSTFKFRFGGYLGTDMKTFVASPNLGLEFLQSISGKTDLVISNNNGYYFFADKSTRWRMSAEIGFRFAL